MYSFQVNSLSLQFLSKMPIYLLLFALFSYEIGADYAGYNAAGRNPGWRSGSEHDPLNVPDVYHKPNEYENQPHAYWLVFSSEIFSVVY